MEILLVDDEEVTRKSVGRFLRRQGHNVQTVQNGKEALLHLTHYTPDVILSDIRMPQMDGLELLKILRVRYVEIPVILLTGHGDTHTAVAALKQGAVDYMLKPIQLSNLVNILNRLSTRKAIERQFIQEHEKKTKTDTHTHPTASSIHMIQNGLQTLHHIWPQIQTPLSQCALEHLPEELPVPLAQIPTLLTDMMTAIEHIAHSTPEFLNASEEPASQQIS